MTEKGKSHFSNYFVQKRISRNTFNVKCIEKIFKIVTLKNFHSILTAKITKNSHFHSYNFFNYRTPN